MSFKDNITIRTKARVTRLKVEESGAGGVDIPPRKTVTGLFYQVRKRSLNSRADKKELYGTSPISLMPSHYSRSGRLELGPCWSLIISTSHPASIVSFQDASGSEQYLGADAVVLATGGFGCDMSKDSLLQRFRPDLVR
jgi:hypothetical protein